MSQLSLKRIAIISVFVFALFSSLSLILYEMHFSTYFKHSDNKFFHRLAVAVDEVEQVAAQVIFVEQNALAGMENGLLNVENRIEQALFNSAEEEALALVGDDESNQKSPNDDDIADAGSFDDDGDDSETRAKLIKAMLKDMDSEDIGSKGKQGNAAPEIEQLEEPLVMND